jgi:branched-chain amino acid transport system ATP-binding protein
VSTLLQVEGLEVRYGTALALRGVNFSIASGAIVGIVGPNGAGKSTLLRTIGGLVRPTAGRILWQGAVVERTSPTNVAALGIAHVPEGRRLIADLSVRDNLRLGAVAAGRVADDMGRVIQIFPAVERLLERRGGQLSGGEQQMVAIGRGLMAQPKLMMIDELSLGLAPKITKQLLSALSRLSSENGLTFLLVDQNVRLLQRHANTMLTMSHGSITTFASGTEHASLDAYVAARS